MKTLSRERLEQAVHAGKIDNDQLEKSLQIQKKEGYLGQVFLTNGYIDEKSCISTCHQLKIPIYN